MAATIARESSRSLEPGDGLSLLHSDRSHERLGDGRLRWRIICGGLLRAGVLLVVVGLYNVTYNGASGLAAMLHGILHNRGNHDFRIAARRETDKPAVHFLGADAIGGVVAHELSGAGFAAKVDVLQTEVIGGAAAFVAHAVEALSDLFNGVVGERETFCFHIGVVLEQVWPHESSAAGNGRGHARELDGCDGDGALTDGDRDRLARVPLVVKYTLDPRLRGHQAGFFAWQINPRAFAEAQA